MSLTRDPLPQGHTTKTVQPLSWWPPSSLWVESTLEAPFGLLKAKTPVWSHHQGIPLVFIPAIKRFWHFLHPFNLPAFADHREGLWPFPARMFLALEKLFLLSEALSALPTLISFASLTLIGSWTWFQPLPCCSMLPQRSWSPSAHVLLPLQIKFLCGSRVSPPVLEFRGPSAASSHLCFGAAPDGVTQGWLLFLLTCPVWRVQHCPFPSLCPLPWIPPLPAECFHKTLLFNKGKWRYPPTKIIPNHPSSVCLHRKNPSHLGPSQTPSSKFSHQEMSLFTTKCWEFKNFPDRGIFSCGLIATSSLAQF